MTIPERFFVYVLKHKYQMLEAFKEFHAKVERETGRNLKWVRSDHDGEYRGPFERYCRNVGIRLEKSLLEICPRGNNKMIIIFPCS